MPKIYVSAKLIKFIKEEGVYNEYVRALHKRHPRGTSKDDVYQSINDSFTWDKTIEGHDFWHELHEKWMEL